MMPSIWPSAAALTMFGGTMRRKMPHKSPALVAPTFSATAAALAERFSSSPAGTPFTTPGVAQFTSKRPVKMERLLVAA